MSHSTIFLSASRTVTYLCASTACNSPLLRSCVEILLPVLRSISCRQEVLRSELLVVMALCPFSLRSPHNPLSIKIDSSSNGRIAPRKEITSLALDILLGFKHPQMTLFFSFTFFSQSTREALQIAVRILQNHCLPATKEALAPPSLLLFRLLGFPSHIFCGCDCSDLIYPFFCSSPKPERTEKRRFSFHSPQAPNPEFQNTRIVSPFPFRKVAFRRERWGQKLIFHSHEQEGAQRKFSRTHLTFSGTFV